MQYAPRNHRVPFELSLTISSCRAPTFHLIPATSKSISPQPSVLEALVTHFPPFITTTSEELPPIPGSGLTARLVSNLPSTFPPTGVILEYVLEGDNRTDALLLASAVAKCLQKDLGITGDGTSMTGTTFDIVSLNVRLQSHGGSRRAGSKGYSALHTIILYLDSIYKNREPGVSRD